MSAYQAGKPRISSTVTKSNPRPRKYASASERQAAYRARAPEVCFRAEAKTVETLDAIADTLDQPRADLLLSMTKFALANHDWARFGLTHKPLPYGYGLAEQEFIGPRQANPQPIWKRTRPKSLGKPVPLTPKQKAAAKKRAAAAGRPYPNLVDNIAAARLENPTVKKPTPAQLAARARFAEMARSGAFKKKAAAKRKANPVKVDLDAWMQEYKTLEDVNMHSENVVRLADLVGTKEDKLLAKRILDDMYRRGYLDQADYKVQYELHKKLFPKLEKLLEKSNIKTNPTRRKKTVSQKISQLVHEGYPQKQAVAVALSEQRAGKVKANPRASNPAKRNPIGDLENLQNRYNKVLITLDDLRQEQKRRKAGLPNEIEGFTNAEIKKLIGIYQSRASDLREAINLYQSNPATGQKGSRTKRNPQPRMAKIAWLTPGGQREVMEVPIDFAFKEYIGNIQEDFFARTDDGFLVVTEKSTGMRVGQVPHTMRAAALNDKAAAKRFVQSIAEKVGAPAFRAAIAKHPRIA